MMHGQRNIKKSDRNLLQEIDSKSLKKIKILVRLKT